MSRSSEAAHARLYASTVARVLARARRHGNEDLEAVAERPVFVLGAPRSGTTFTARAIASQPGFVDLGEVAPQIGRASCRERV